MTDQHIMSRFASTRFRYWLNEKLDAPNKSHVRFRVDSRETINSISNRVCYPTSGLSHPATRALPKKRSSP